MVNTFFTSDTHYWHNNILKYCSETRQFESVEEMNETMIANHNSKVGKHDIVWHLGDVAFCRAEDTRKIFNRLNGRFRLIIGNHDKKSNIDGVKFESISSYEELKLNGKTIVMMHYPLLSWNKAFHGSIHFHGHCHGNIPSTNRRIDVGVDCWGMTPMSLEEIMEQAENFPEHINAEE